LLQVFPWLLHTIFQVANRNPLNQIILPLHGPIQMQMIFPQSEAALIPDLPDWATLVPRRIPSSRQIPRVRVACLRVPQLHLVVCRLNLKRGHVCLPMIQAELPRCLSLVIHVCQGIPIRCLSVVPVLLQTEQNLLLLLGLLFLANLIQTPSFLN
jgi:hypothetical protein